MADFLKKPLGQSLNDLAIKRASDAIQKQGRALPCTVAEVVSSGIVTLNFEVNASPFTLPNVTVPIACPSYVRYPVQVGDKGMVVPADVRLGNISGLGSGTVPDLSQPANLAALAFVWLGSTGWAPALDPQALELWGNVLVKPTELGFFATATVTKQTVSGPLSSVTDPAAQAVLTSLIDALSAYGLIINGTS